MGKGSTLTIEVKSGEGEPIFLALARAVITEIERGRLRPGDPLPGTRAMSRTLKLNRNTVDAAYHELTMQGWLTAEPSKGTFVARDLPDAGRKAEKTASSKPVRGDVKAARTIVSLSDGLPDPRLAPTAALGQAFRRALASPTFLTSTDYGDPRGGRALRGGPWPCTWGTNGAWRPVRTASSSLAEARWPCSSRPAPWPTAA